MIVTVKGVRTTYKLEVETRGTRGQIMVATVKGARTTYNLEAERGARS